MAAKERAEAVEVFLAGSEGKPLVLVDTGLFQHGLRVEVPVFLSLGRVLRVVDQHGEKGLDVVWYYLTNGLVAHERHKKSEGVFGIHDVFGAQLLATQVGEMLFYAQGQAVAFVHGRGRSTGRRNTTSDTRLNPDTFALGDDGPGRFIIGRRPVGGNPCAVRQVDDELASVARSIDGFGEQVFRVSHGVLPHPFEESGENIPDSGGSEPGRVTAFAAEAQDDVARAQGGVEYDRHKEPGAPAGGAFENVWLWQLIPRLMPRGINRARKNPLRCKGFSPDLVEVAMTRSCVSTKARLPTTAPGGHGLGSKMFRGDQNEVGCVKPCLNKQGGRVMFGDAFEHQRCAGLIERLLDRMPKADG